jgi:hypothetical protein
MDGDRFSPEIGYLKGCAFTRPNPAEGSCKCHDENDGDQPF